MALTVTAPFMLPYAVAAAARLKGARSALIMHDLFPDVLVMAGMLKPASLSRERYAPSTRCCSARSCRHHHRPRH